MISSHFHKKKNISATHILIARTKLQLDYAHIVSKKLSEEGFTPVIALHPSITSWYLFRHTKNIISYTKLLGTISTKQTVAVIKSLLSYAACFKRYALRISDNDEIELSKAIRQAYIKASELLLFETILGNNVRCYGNNKCSIVHFELYSFWAYTIRKTASKFKIQTQCIQVCDFIHEKLPHNLNDDLLLVDSTLYLGKNLPISLEPKYHRFSGSIRFDYLSKPYHTNESIDAQDESSNIVFCSAPRSYRLQNSIISEVFKSENKSIPTILLHPRDSSRHYKSFKTHVFSNSCKQKLLSNAKIVISPLSAVLYECIILSIPFVCIPFDNVDSYEDSPIYRESYNGFLQNNKDLIPFIRYCMSNYSDLKSSFEKYIHDLQPLGQPSLTFNVNGLLNHD